MNNYIHTYKYTETHTYVYVLVSLLIYLHNFIITIKLEHKVMNRKLKR